MDACPSSRLGSSRSGESEYCGPAAHLCPEDRPEETAAAVNAWAARHALAE
ncbi:hypothetical protein OHA91_09710 [Streptomyces erythrochromogenes]|uniref:Uncharacterized protein n=1 Tax=Streptomyces erythrochromogenes TaxID=285574 RepID=A0ABZ1QP99_9ACTN|nr:hypothetical protein [Streptomyces erythrochromogenes]